MATPARTTSTATLDVLSSPSAADSLSAEVHEWADRVEAEAREGGTSRITAARVRGLRRHAGQLERLAAADTE